MKAQPSHRKAAIALSLMSASQQRRFMKTISPGMARQLDEMVLDIKGKGWSDLKLIEIALGEPLIVKAPDTLGIEELIFLSQHVGPGAYSRILATLPPLNHTFLFTLLEKEYGEQVQARLVETPALPPRLAGAVGLEVHRLLALRAGEVCAA